MPAQTKPKGTRQITGRSKGAALKHQHLGMGQAIDERPSVAGEEE